MCGSAPCPSQAQHLSGSALALALCLKHLVCAPLARGGSLSVPCDRLGQRVATGLTQDPSPPPPPPLAPLSLCPSMLTGPPTFSVWITCRRLSVSLARFSVSFAHFSVPRTLALGATRTLALGVTLSVGSRHCCPGPSCGPAPSPPSPSFRRHQHPPLLPRPPPPSPPRDRDLKKSSQKPPPPSRPDTGEPSMSTYRFLVVRLLDV